MATSCQHAETFAVAGKGMVESAAEIYPEAVLQGAARSQDRSARGQPESLDDLLRIREFEAHALAGRERIVFQFFARTPAYARATRLHRWPARE